MINKIKKYSFLLILSLVGLSSCTDKDLFMGEEPDIIEEFKDENVLTLKISLTDMAEGSIFESNPMKEVENYIDPEKFRVLFFTAHGNFLFESKSRWVKKLTHNSTDDKTMWKIAVPFFSYGNDTEYNWNWKVIKDSLTSRDFKIAILANRPGTDCFPELENNANAAGNKWFDNTGPHWNASNSIATEGVDPKNVKRIFDLHHSQWDPIYNDKGLVTQSNITTQRTNYYEFMGETIGTNPTHNFYSSSTASWVQWQNENSSNPVKKKDGGNTDDYGWGYRLSRLPDMNYPIPMYGIQKYDQIIATEWLDGTTFDLVREQDEPVHMLRSAVRLDFLVPIEYDIDYLILFYSNIYSRCEPMNIWDPTETIWSENHDDQCEWKKIAEYGPVTRPTDGYAGTDFKVDGNADNYGAKEAYQKRMVWFYGSWISQGWNFPSEYYPNDKTGEWAKAAMKTNSLNGNVILGDDGQPFYPKVFNPCIQRNNLIYVDKENDFGDVPGYHHYIVYTGERNVNDPTALHRLGANTSGNPTIIYWGLGINTQKNAAGKKTRGERHFFVIADYDDYDDDQIHYHDSTGANGDVYSYDASGNPAKCEKQSFINPIEQAAMAYEGTKLVGNNTVKGIKTLPLLRNHVYRITLGKKTTRGGSLDFNVKSEVLYNKDL